MKAIIACAGMGTRLGVHSGGKPKSTLELPNGKPLIIYTIEMLKSLGFTKIVLVVGFKKEILEELVKPFGDLVKTYFNPFFEVSGTAGSFFHAKEEFDGSSKMLLMNGDSFYTKEIYEKILNFKDSPVLLIDKARKDNADMKIRLDEKNYCIEYDKGIQKADAESCDLFVISKEYSLIYKKNLEEICYTQVKTAWWESAIINYGNTLPVHTLDVEGDFWSEIDYLEDYERIINYFKQK